MTFELLPTEDDQSEDQNEIEVRLESFFFITILNFAVSNISVCSEWHF